MDATTIINYLMDYYQVGTISELALKMDSSQPTISKWRKNNSINAIKKKCRELGIYDDIFGNFINQSHASFNNASTGVDMSSGSKTISNQNSPFDELLDESNKHLLLSYLALAKGDQIKIREKILKLLADG